MKMFRTLSLLAAAISLAMTAGLALAADYPSKQINMIMAFSAGGSSDVQARIMEKYWNKYANQRWTFIYKTGAGGALGFAEIARAKPDGYTIGGLNMPHIVLQKLGQNAQFDPQKSFAYICQVVNDPQCVAVKKGSPFKTMKELMDYAKANPGKVTVGMSGKLSGHGLMFLDFKKKYPDVKFADVYYKGAAEQNVALLGGEVMVIFGNLNDVMRATDQMDVLGMASEKRNTFLPNVPTLREQGYDIVSDIRRCFAAPAGIGAKELKYLRDTFRKICTDPGYLADMKKAGQPAEYMDGPDFEAYVKSQYGKAEKALGEAGMLKK